jgi:serine/threonine-protein kinase
MLAGEPLFTGRTPQEVIARRFQQQRPSLERLRAGVPRSLRLALERALALSPSERFPTAGELALAVAASLRGGPLARLAAAVGRLGSAIAHPH